MRVPSGIYLETCYWTKKGTKDLSLSYWSISRITTVSSPKCSSCPFLLSCHKCYFWWWLLFINPASLNYKVLKKKTQQLWNFQSWHCVLLAHSTQCCCLTINLNTPCPSTAECITPIWRLVSQTSWEVQLTPYSGKSLQKFRKDELRWTWCCLWSYCWSAEGNICWVALGVSSAMDKEVLEPDGWWLCEAEFRWFMKTVKFQKPGCECPPFSSKFEWSHSGLCW